MTAGAVRLYALNVSHPSVAAHLMLERKRISHRVLNIQPGFHPLLVRLAGFPGNTVPALEIGGRRVQGSLAISRALEALQPLPPLFPVDSDARNAVEEAEAWGERVLQPMPRRMYRWGLTRNRELRRRLLEASGMPAPGLTAAMNGPLAGAFAAAIGADDDQVRRDVRELPAQLDHVDALIFEGVIGNPEPNAADFQIAATIRVMLSFHDLAPMVAWRPAAELALRLVPEWPDEVPRFLPDEWL
ncbi:MAG: glutathione S-transferase [Candidatus Rokuibacteriota bacterium]|nr:MAG: glutathione S-transferase [Candidatus Rokubacteria bacterium]